MNGRKKLELRIALTHVGEEGTDEKEWTYTYEGAGDVNLFRGGVGMGGPGRGGFGAPRGPFAPGGPQGANFTGGRGGFGGAAPLAGRGGFGGSRGGFMDRGNLGPGRGGFGGGPRGGFSNGGMPPAASSVDLMSSSSAPFDDRRSIRPIEKRNSDSWGDRSRPPPFRAGPRDDVNDRRPRNDWGSRGRVDDDRPSFGGGDSYRPDPRRDVDRRGGGGWGDRGRDRSREGRRGDRWSPPPASDRRGRDVSFSPVRRRERSRSRSRSPSREKGRNDVWGSKKDGW